MGAQSIDNAPLVDPANVILPPLHIKLGLMSSCVKAMNKDSEAFKYLKTVFPKLSINKIEKECFNGPQIEELINNNNFI